MKKYMPKEAWADDAESIVLVRTTTGGFNAYVAADAVEINGQFLIDNPVVANKIIDLKIQVFEAKQANSKLG